MEGFLVVRKDTLQEFDFFLKSNSWDQWEQLPTPVGRSAMQPSISKNEEDLRTFGEETLAKHSLKRMKRCGSR